ncbi:MAG: hypothetical protein FWC50_07855 [Planctomycetaceae bacterium]|nr:hypothetical protein [Planctomycetaceae bacterium]
MVIPQSAGTAAFGLAQPPCIAEFPHSASEISHRFEYTWIHKQTYTIFDRDEKTPSGNFYISSIKI